MSLKGVELQIAIPKTFDAGKIAEQQNQHVTNTQMHANEELKKEIERKNTLVNDTENLDAISEDDEKEQQNPDHPNGKKNKQSEESKPAKHPFKGNFIDFSG